MPSTYTKPARDAVDFASESGYVKPARNAVNIRAGDDPIYTPKPTLVIADQAQPNSLRITFPQVGSVNRLSGNRKLQRRLEADAYVDATTVGDAQISFVEPATLLQGREYHYRLSVSNSLGSKTGNSLSAFTDALVKIINVRDADLNILEGATCFVIVEGDFDGVSQTAQGEEVTGFSKVFANLSDSEGKCDIRVPGGRGLVSTVFIEDLINGGIRSHVDPRSDLP